MAGIDPPEPTYRSDYRYAVWSVFFYYKRVATGAKQPESLRALLRDFSCKTGKLRRIRYRTVPVSISRKNNDRQQTFCLCAFP